MSKPRGPFKLVTVNTAPERAFRLIGRVTEGLKDKYTIQHVTNCAAIEEVAEKVQEVQPDLLAVPSDHMRHVLRSQSKIGLQCCASMWTPEQSAQIMEIARSKAPHVKTYAIPQGLQVEKGPDAIVEHLSEKLPAILDTLPDNASTLQG